MAAQERLYEQQRGPARPTPLPYASAESYGAGVGEAMGRLGETVERQQADQQLADFSAKFAEARLAADKASTDARNNPAPGAAGHAQALSDWWKGQADQLTSGITNSHVLRAAKQQLTEFGTRFDASEYQYEAGARVGKLVTDTQQASDLAANRARQAHDPKSFAEELTLGRQSIDALQGVPGDVKEKLLRHHDETVTIGYLNGLNDSNPAAAVALIDGGAFNDLLTPQQIDQARNGAAVEVRRIEAEQRAQDQVARAEARERIATVNARLEAGEEVPDGELAAASQSAQALGDDSGSFKLDVARAKSGLARITQSWQPADWEKNINDLRALGSNRTAQQDITLKYLEQIAPARIAEFNNNPGGYMARIGRPPPPLNLSDPGSIAARVRWQGAASEATRRAVPLLTDAEADQFGAMARGGPQKRAELAEALSRFGGTNAIRAAAQVAPKDWTLQQAIALPARLRVELFEGEKLRGGNQALAPAGEIKAHFEARAALALAELPASYRNGVLATATNLYAFRAARTGADMFDQDLFDGALADAIDPSGKGGIGEWNGRPVKLPYGMSQADFDRRLSRMGGLKGAYHADKSPISASELRQRFAPVAAPVAGHYWFVDGRGRYALDAQGGRAALRLDD
jgi:hypothetical protein